MLKLPSFLTNRKAMFLGGLTLIFVEYLGALSFPTFHDRYVEGELGIVENIQALLLLLALLTAIGMQTLFAIKRDFTLSAYLVLIALGLFWVLGEEISWGQHYFQWTATGWFELHNDQLETNLHNTSSWFDQKPRLLLLVGITLGGILHPLLLRWKGEGISLFTRPWWLAPTMASLPLAVLVALCQLPKFIDGFKVLPFTIQPETMRFSETQELFIYAFMLHYLLMIVLRLQKRPRKA